MPILSNTILHGMDEFLPSVHWQLMESSKLTRDYLIFELYVFHYCLFVSAVIAPFQIFLLLYNALF